MIWTKRLPGIVFLCARQVKFHKKCSVATYAHFFDAMLSLRNGCHIVATIVFEERRLWVILANPKA